MSIQSILEMTVSVFTTCEDIQLYNGKNASFTLTVEGDYGLLRDYDIELEGEVMYVDLTELPNPCPHIVMSLAEAVDETEKLYADDETRDDADRPSETLRDYLDDLPEEELTQLWAVIKEIH